MMSFDELAASRREWIDTVLRPWCARAERRELLKAHVEWTDIAGRVDPEATLWTWAWERFPALVHDGLAGVNETAEVHVKLRDVTAVTGFPDARQSRLGQLVVVCRSASGRYDDERGPFPLDEIASVERVS